MSVDLIKLLSELPELIEKLEAIGFGDESAVIEHQGQNRPSVAGAIKDKFAALQAMVQGRLTFETKTQLDAHTPTADANGQYPLAEVWGDSGENNGLYGYSGTAWATAAEYDPRAYALVLEDRVGPIETQNLPPESGYIWALVDKDTGRAAVRVRPDGTFEVDKIKYPAGSIPHDALDADMAGSIGSDLYSESGYVWALVDPVSGRTPVRLHKDGTLEVYSLKAGLQTIEKKMLSREVQREALPVQSDHVESVPCTFREALAQVATQTAPGDGSLWVSLPERKTKLLHGINNSGSDLEFRKASNLILTGQSFSGSFDPGAVQSIKNVGTLSGPSVSTPTGTFSSGDYYYYGNGAGTTSTGTFSGMKVGDLLVFNGSSWVIQAAPGAFGSRNRHAAYKVTAAGVFDGVEYAVDDFIVYLGRQPGGGGWQYERWFKPARGQFCYCGEFDPAVGIPAGIENAVYQASAAGITAGKDWQAGDYAVFIDGQFRQVNGSKAITVQSAESVSLPCVNSAAEWEVRRIDKSATRAGVRLDCSVSTAVKRSGSDLLLLSDSMFGVSGVGTKIIQDSGRTGVVKSFGGGTSEQILGMIEYEIAALGDRYSASTLIAWHGQNNQPYNEANAAQIREVSQRLVQLAGSRDIRAVFLTVLGQRAMSWNGSRLVCEQHENQFNSTGYLTELTRWYESAFPGMVIDVHKVLLARGTTAADPEFPGMNEQEVAETYGIVPWSFFNPPSVSWATDDLDFIGYWTSATLPTGGSHLEYYIRTDNGTHGSLIVNESGTWYERKIDRTHLSPAGAAALSAAVNEFLTEKSI